MDDTKRRVHTCLRLSAWKRLQDCESENKQIFVHRGRFVVEKFYEMTRVHSPGMSVSVSMSVKYDHPQPLQAAIGFSFSFLLP